jgi:hypothetical protein
MHIRVSGLISESKMGKSYAETTSFRPSIRKLVRQSLTNISEWIFCDFRDILYIPVISTLLDQLRRNLAYNISVLNPTLVVVCVR